MRRPSAVARFVVAVGVDAVERLACGSLAHISKEVLEAEGSLPASADPDAWSDAIGPAGVERAS
jgi:hypothetical protein